MVTAIEPLLSDIRAMSEHIKACDEQMQETDDTKRCGRKTDNDCSEYGNHHRFVLSDGGAFGGAVLIWEAGGGVSRAGTIVISVRASIQSRNDNQKRQPSGQMGGVYGGKCIAARKKQSALKSWWESLVERLGRQKAIIAISRRLSVFWAMMKNRADFEPRLKAV